MRTLILSLYLLAFGAVVSCTSTTTEPEPTPDPTIRAGSTMTFYREVTDDTLWTDVLTSDTITYTVASVDTTFAGVNHAYFLSSDDDTLVYTIESNGDVKLYQQAVAISGTELVFPEGWSTLPGVSKTLTITDFDIDSPTTLQGQEANVGFERYSGYIGETTDTLNGRTLTLQTSYVESIVRVTVNSVDYITRFRTEYSYSPELKTFVGYRQKTWSNHSFSPIPNGGLVRTLIDFKL